MTSFGQLSDGFCFSWPIKMRQLWEADLSSSLLAFQKLSPPPLIPTCILIGHLQRKPDQSYQKDKKQWKPCPSGNDRTCCAVMPDVFVFISILFIKLIFSFENKSTKGKIPFFSVTVCMDALGGFLWKKLKMVKILFTEDLCRCNNNIAVALFWSWHEI